MLVRKRRYIHTNWGAQEDKEHLQLGKVDEVSLTWPSLSWYCFGRVVLVGYQKADDSYLYYRVHLFILNNYILLIPIAHLQYQYIVQYIIIYKAGTIYNFLTTTQCIIVRDERWEESINLDETIYTVVTTVYK